MGEDGPRSPQGQAAASSSGPQPTQVRPVSPDLVVGWQGSVYTMSGAQETGEFYSSERQNIVRKGCFILCGKTKSISNKPHDLGEAPARGLGLHDVQSGTCSAGSPSRIWTCFQLIFRDAAPVEQSMITGETT